MAKAKPAAKPTTNGAIPEAAIANGKQATRGTKRTLAVGPISIATIIYVAARSEGISFNMLHDVCHGRLKQAGYYCPCCVEVAILKKVSHQFDEEAKADPVSYEPGDIAVVPSAVAEDWTKRKIAKPTEAAFAMVEKQNIVKGFEVGNDEYVTITKEEIDGQKAMADDTMIVEQFVPLNQVNPLYFERSYYLTPDPNVSRKSFALLRSAMVEEQKAAVAKLTSSQQERLVFILPYGDAGMALHEAFLPNEIRSIAFPSLDSVANDELAVATQFIEAMSGDLDMTRYKDSYQENLQALIDAKKAGVAPKAVVQKKAPNTGGNLIEMMKASIALANKKRVA